MAYRARWRGQPRADQQPPGHWSARERTPLRCLTMRERRQLGQWIASARKARGWRTVDLAAAAGCAERTVRQLEAARDLPTLAVLRRVAYTLGIGFRCGLLVGAALRAAPYGYQTDAARNRRRREISQRAAECRAGRQGAGPR